MGGAGAHHVPSELAAVVVEALSQATRKLVDVPPAPRVVPRPERQLPLLQPHAFGERRRTLAGA